MASFYTSLWYLNPGASELLEELVKEGMSTREIAETMSQRMGATFTPGAVISKLKRMRLTLKRVELRAAKAAQELLDPPPLKARDRAVRLTQGVFNPSFKKDGPVPPRHPTAPLVVSDHPGYPFLKVPPGGCLYEISSGMPLAKEMVFCGQPRAPGEPYCEANFNITLAPAEVRIRFKARRV